MSRVSPLRTQYPATTTYAPMGSVEVPWIFGGVEEEYRALREQVALLDYSYMDRLQVRGEAAMDFLQAWLTRDIEYLVPERAVTGLVLEETGRPLSIVTVYNLEKEYVLEAAPGTGAGLLKVLQETKPEGVEVRDISDEQAVIGLEGPFAWKALAGVVDFDVSILPYQGVLNATWNGEPLLVSRTGFTAEYGYKIYAAPDTAAQIWDALKEEARPVAYQVLETAMLEVRQPNFHRELDAEGSVIRCGWNWLVDIQKEQFVGRKALLLERQAGPDYLTVGFVANAGTRIAAGARVRAVEPEVGRVVWTAYSPGLGKVLGLIRSQAEWAASGLDLEVQDVEGVWQPIRTASSPYVLPKSWSQPIV